LFRRGSSAQFGFSNPSQRRESEKSIKWTLIGLRFCGGFLRKFRNHRLKVNSKRPRELHRSRNLRTRSRGFPNFPKKNAQSCAREEFGQFDLQICSSYVIAFIKPSQSVPSPSKNEITQNARKGGSGEGKLKQNKSSNIIHEF
jgi:hypothetical protein